MSQTTKAEAYSHEAMRMKDAHARRMNDEAPILPPPDSEVVPDLAAQIADPDLHLAAPACLMQEPTTARCDVPSCPEHDARPDEERQIADAILRLGGALSVENVRGLITAECRELEALLHEKNAAYGNSALDPVRLFSRSSAIEQLFVRIDDKISRIARGDFSKVKEEDLKVVTKDLLGYLILVRVAWRLGLE